MKLIGVNGLHSDGGRNTDLVLADLRARGFYTCDFNYPRATILTAGRRRIQYRNARSLLEMHDHGDAVIAHSYGCLVVLRAMELGARFGAVFFFAAAMNADFVFPYLGMARLINIYNPFDKAVFLGGILLRHDFGDLGRTGYAGAPDPRIGCLQDTVLRGGLLNHSQNYFTDQHRGPWVDLIERELRKEPDATR